ncbi:MAG TPA: glycosyltransferase [Vicinamibacterales bacterium]|jgi:glycosyltransferase involved in cell wall biosynthesis
MNVTSASILICTYNRGPLLRDTLAALQALHRPPDCDVEIVVVDNNSSDDTPRIIAEATRRPGIPVISVRETKQGKSFALNRGLAAVRGDIVALTDDDVWPDPDWLARIVADFRERDVTFVFGKVLPRWGQHPPPELLTLESDCIWGPLAIVDYGDVAAEYLPESTGQRLPVGANLAFTREALSVIGGWRTDLGKVNGTLISGEDHEIFMRLRRRGLYHGYYDPAVAVRHFVPAGRLTRRYFRQWFFWHGKTQALMLDDLYPELEMEKVPRIGGVPRFLYRESFKQWGRWAWSLPSANALDVLIEELRSLRYAGLISECWRRRKLTARREFDAEQGNRPSALSVR